MNAHLQAAYLRALKRNPGPITETQLVAVAMGTFLDLTESECREDLRRLESDGLVVASRVPVLNSIQYGLTATGASAAATLR